MEKEGLIREIIYFEQNGVQISQSVTDRHFQVAKSGCRKTCPRQLTILMSGTLLKVKKKPILSNLKKNYRHLLVEEYYSSIDCHS